jgi:hypothetical protein
MLVVDKSDGVAFERRNLGHWRVKIPYGIIGFEGRAEK